MYKFNHQYHLVDYSPWPIISAFSTLSLFLSIIKIFYWKNNYLFLISFITILIITFQWWRDIIRESTFQGMHLLKVIMGLKWSMILFILSELFFFISFFWTFFHSSLSLNIELGLIWPPQSIIPFNPFKIPLLNTIILLTSGISLTWAHYNMLNKNFKNMIISLMLTIFLGFYFSSIQMFEYYQAPFSLSDSSYGSSFFLATGFHGIHVLIGTSFLLICLFRHINNHFSNLHHFGFEASAWYWHFVDIIWLFLFVSIYWWGS